MASIFFARPGCKARTTARERSFTASAPVAILARLRSTDERQRLARLLIAALCCEYHGKNGPGPGSHRRISGSFGRAICAGTLSTLGNSLTRR